MKIFKFGGASTRDAHNIENVVSIIKKSGQTDLVVVVSALGKMTNALEVVVSDYFKTGDFSVSLKFVYDFHLEIIRDLFPDSSHRIYSELENVFSEITRFLKLNKSENHAFVYDQTVSQGEILASKIVSAALLKNGIENTWLDVRTCIKTDDTYRDARVNWDETETEITGKVLRTGITVTQGFLGAESENNFTTTLGREGSDYSAAIFAYCLNAEYVVIWKDVPGVLNADPRYFSNTRLLEKLSYKEAIELAFYGASVIHPKTLQPLQRKNIPLYVKSFLNPENPGTFVGNCEALKPNVSCFILKKNLTLISLSALDFNFMMEDHIGDVFKLLHQYQMKVELIQNSAISFSVCISDKFNNLKPLLEKLRENFRVKWNENVTLYTVRHSHPVEIRALAENKKIILKQETQETVQLITKE